jgi:hypothetical protein
MCGSSSKSDRTFLKDSSLRRWLIDRAIIQAVKKRIVAMSPPATMGFLSSGSNDAAPTDPSSAAIHSVPAIRWNLSGWGRFGVFIISKYQCCGPDEIAILANMRAVVLQSFGFGDSTGSSIIFRAGVMDDRPKISLATLAEMLSLKSV